MHQATRAHTTLFWLETSLQILGDFCSLCVCLCSLGGSCPVLLFSKLLCITMGYLGVIDGREDVAPSALRDILCGFGTCRAGVITMRLPLLFVHKPLAGSPLASSCTQVVARACRLMATLPTSARCTKPQGKRKGICPEAPDRFFHE